MSEQDTDASGTEDEEEKEEDKDIDESEVKDAVELDTSGKVLTDSEIIKKYHFVDSDEDDLNSISDAEEYSPPIAALPPKISKQEENQVEISSSPAYQCLEELFQEGKLTGTKVAFLKAKYSELHETLKRTRENESRLLQEAKKFANDLDKQCEELEKGDNFPENSNTEVSKMREQLLKYNNDLIEAEDKQYQLEYKIECLDEEKKIIQREYSRLPKQGEIEKKIKELQNGNEEMRKEVLQRQNEVKTLVEDLDRTNHQIAHDKKEFEKLTEDMEKLKAELVQINFVPGQTAKEADKILRQKNSIQSQLEALDAEYMEKLEIINNMEVQQKALKDEYFEAETKLKSLRSLLSEKERAFATVEKEYEHAKERETMLNGDKANLDMNLRHIQMERKNLHDIYTRKLKEKERDIRNLKKAELQLKVAEENLNHTKSIHEKVKSQVACLPKDDGSTVKKLEELQKEVEQAKRALAQQNSLTAVEHVKLEASALEEQNLLYEQSDLRIEVVELTRLAAIKADEREQKARDFMRAEMKYHRAVEDLKTKQLQIQDHQKKFQEMQIKLNEFAKLYDVIKNERNKCVNLIQTSSQKAAEMKEKIKILNNEIEILRTAVMLKDKELQKNKLKRMNAIVMRDSLRNELTKQQHLAEEMKAKRDQQKVELGKLNLLINQGEEQMNKLKERFENNVKHRNERGVKLIERNEEVCVFYERVNIQDQMVRNGEVELKTKEEEIRFLQLQKQEMKRSLELLRKNVPEKLNLEKELVTLQIQLEQCQDRMLAMEKSLENPYDETRVRQLTGIDPSPGEIHSKVEELELRLAEKEERLLEKDLIFDQVERLVSRISNKAQAGKDDTLNLAKSVNNIQARLKETTRKMMALVSELSMNQAQAMKLQQEVKEKEAELEQCYIRMEKGDAPSQEIELEWEKMMRDLERKIEEVELRRQLEAEEEQYKLAGGVYTTAVPRPNAYIPEDESELPIPRPYGTQAPFKPSETGSSMRHIRKPVPKPIEI
ncbi:coiled-coil domain-containing protein 146-like [Biomphalaria glabrata]|uniref:Coiled-coil domain-containing protein 146-like n=1 Tax=Biomphalaria glabrata TaxID=6526 RepID=A0A9U8DWY8_BIOGL|nr:coiled-coil domain-containing protein 146-like [Biomphalaria glabrata]XP_013065194.2 coiled-coil domain-containing protein 146-like [Biomphalaria glabrata]